MDKTVDLKILKRFISDNLVAQLHTLDGKKDLILDAELMKPLDLICGASLLRKNGADKIFKLQDGDSYPSENNSQIFIVRPYLHNMRQISAAILSDQKNSIQRKYHIVLTPKRLTTCDLILEREGIYGDVTIDELPLDMVTLDQDVLSLEMPRCYKQFTLDNDLTWLATVARAISTMNGTYGKMHQVYGIGDRAKNLLSLMDVMMSEEREFLPQGGPEIGSMIILDRDVDMVSIMTSQLTYEGLVDECFNIKSSNVEFGSEITGAEKSISLRLNSEDQVFHKIRGMHITAVFPYLSGKAKELQSIQDKSRDLSVAEMRKFVSEDLKELKEQHKSLALHIAACEAIMKKKSQENFEDCMNAEHCLLDDTDYKESFNYIETCVLRQDPFLKCLRLLCLLSLCKGGLDTKSYKSLKLQFMQSFGYHHLATFARLRDMGLFSESTDKRQTFPRLRKKLNLIPKDPDQINKREPNDVSYVFGGAYHPLSIKLVEMVLTKGYPHVEEILRNHNISSFDKKYPSSVRSSSSNTQTSTAALKTTLVVFLGGCSHTEINALRFLGKLRGQRFIVLTTCVLTSQTLLQTLLPDAD